MRVVILLLITLLSASASAYIDPGTGGAIVGSMGAVVGGIIAIIGAFLARFLLAPAKRALSVLFKRKP